MIYRSGQNLAEKRGGSGLFFPEILGTSVSSRNWDTWHRINNFEKKKRKSSIVLQYDTVTVTM